MRGDVHVGCGGRAGETHQEQSRQGAPVRPDPSGTLAPPFLTSPPIQEHPGRRGQERLHQ